MILQPSDLKAYFKVTVIEQYDTYTEISGIEQRSEKLTDLYIASIQVSFVCVFFFQRIAQILLCD